MKIYAPVKDANGIWCTVRFVNGVGETDNPKLINWFKNHGYEVEDTPTMTSGYVSTIEVAPVETQDCFTTVASTEPDFDSMTSNELRDYLKANGYGAKIKNIRNKEKLLEILRG